MTSFIIVYYQYKQSCTDINVSIIDPKNKVRIEGRSDQRCHKCHFYRIHQTLHIHCPYNTTRGSPVSFSGKKLISLIES